MRKICSAWLLIIVLLLTNLVVDRAAAADWVLNSILNGGSVDMAPYIYSCCGNCTGGTGSAEAMLEDEDSGGVSEYWPHNVAEVHTLIIDLGHDYIISAARARSEMARDPDDVDVQVATEEQGPSFASGFYTEVVTAWNFADTDPANYAATSGNHYRSFTSTTARYVKVLVQSTEHGAGEANMYWGANGGDPGNWTDTGPHPGFDVYGTVVDAAKSVVYSPTADTTTIEWTLSGGSGTHYDDLAYLSGASAYVYENASSNERERLKWSVVPSGSQIGSVRLWWKGKEHTGPARLSWPQYYDFGATTLYPATYDVRDAMAFQFNNDWRYYYREWLTHPDGGAWEIADFTDWRGGVTSLGSAQPGGEICEMFLQVITLWGDVGAICNIAPWCGGETDDELIVKTRTTGAAKVRFAYATSQGPLLMTTNPDSPVSGVTVESNPAADNAVAANDYVYTKRFTGLDADTTYYFTVFVDGYPSHVTERVNLQDGTATSNPPNDTTGVLTDTAADLTADEFNGYILVITSGTASGNTYTIDDTTATTFVCSGDNLYAAGVRSGDSYCIAAPESMWLPLNHWKTAGEQGTAINTTNIYIGDRHSYLVQDDILFQSAAAAGASGVCLLGDNHSENSQSNEPASWSASAGLLEGYRRCVFGYTPYARHFSYEILKDHTIRAATPSDHDWGGNNVDKVGWTTTNVISGKGWDDVNFTPAAVTFNDSPATIVVNPDSGDVNIYEDNILIKVTGGNNAGTYQADVSSISGDTYTFSVSPAPTDESDPTCRVDFIKGRTWNARKAYNLYMPNRIDPDGDGLGDEITIGGNRHLPLPADDITGTASGGSSTTLVDTDMNPVMFSVDNISGTFTEGETVTWTGGGSGKLIYWDSSIGKMVVYWTNIGGLANNVQIANGGDTCDVDDATNAGRNWPTVGTFGIYPGRVVYHLPESTSDYSLSWVKSVSGQTITFTEALWAGEEFASTEAYRIQIATINQRRYHGADMYLTLDVRALRDTPRSDTANPGGDWLDGTKDGIDEKVKSTATAGTDTNTIVCSTCGFGTTDEDSFGRDIVIGDLVLIDLDDDGTYDDDYSSENYAIVSAVTDSTHIELSREITGLGSGDDFLIQESGGSDHGSRIANINAGHVMREWLCDALSPISSGGSRPSWNNWALIICEQPFHDLILDAGSYDKPGDMDPLDALYNYVKSNILILKTVWTSADRHLAALYDALNDVNPFPSMNASPAYCDVGGIVAYQNHKVGTEWTTRVSGGVFKFSGWGLDSAAADGVYTENVARNKGAFGKQIITSSTITATLYDPDGVILNNDHYAQGESAARTIVSIADDTPGAAYSRITVASSSFTANEHNGMILRVKSCAGNADTINNEYVIYDTGTNYVDIKVEDLGATTGLAADDTFEVREKMWLGVEAYTENPSIGNMTCTWSINDYLGIENANLRGFFEGFVIGFGKGL